MYNEDESEIREKSENLSEEIKSDIKNKLNNPAWVNSPASFLWKSEDIPPEVKNLTREDILTGIPAVSKEDEFNNWIDSKIQKSLSDGKNVGVVVLDMNQLKKLNDSLSRDHGDALVEWAIGKTSNSLNENFSKSGNDSPEIFLARKGEKGDEIVIYFFGISKEGSGFDGGFRKRLNKFEEALYEDFTYTPTDSVAQKKGIDKITFSMSLGSAFTYQNNVMAKVNEELGSETGHQNDKLTVKDNWKDNPQVVARVMNRVADNRVGAMKLEGDIHRIGKDLLAEEESVPVFISKTSPEYGDSRIDNIVLSTLGRFCSAKVVDVIERKTGKLRDEYKDLERILKNPKQSINLLKAYIEDIFGKAENTEKRSKKINHNKGWFDQRMDMACGVDWRTVPNAFQYQNNSLYDKEIGSFDDKTKLLAYSSEVRRGIVDAVSRARVEGKRVLVASIDANQLKKANNISWDLGDNFIVRNAAIVTQKLEVFSAKEGVNMWVLSRDAAGDEIIVVAISDNEGEASNILNALDEINNWKENIDLEDGKSFSLSTTSAAVTDADFPEIADATEKNAYTLYEKMLKTADDRVKVIKASKQIEGLPLREFVNSQNVSEAIEMVNNDFGGGRMSGDSLNMILSVISSKAAFDYCLKNDIDINMAVEIFEELFSSGKFSNSPEKVQDAYKNLVGDLRNFLREKYTF